MLNYLGPNIGPGPVSAGLPPAMPGTMPQAVPGVSPMQAPLPIMQHGAPSPAALAAISQRAVVPGPESAPPPPPEYGTVTQEDGSILLHIKNADGTLGPVVKVLPPIRRADAPTKSS